MIRAGKLRHRIVILRGAETVNDYGSKETTWTEHASARAEIVSISYGETDDDTGTADTETVTFRLRTVDLTPADRIPRDGRDFDIRSIREIANGRGLELTCEAL